MVRFPDVGPAGSEAGGAKAHRLQRHIAGKQQQVGPADLLAVLLLDRPEQSARLVDIDIVGPAVERREALLPATAAAAAVGGAVGAGGMPGHPHELRAIVAEVGRPPVLRVGHQRQQILLQREVVELPEFSGIVEACPQRIGFVRVLVQQLKAKLVGPPVGVRRAAAGGVVERTFCFT